MKDKKKIVIGTLCALIMIMAVGYALLSQQLRITGSASITSNWQVEITNVTEKEKSTETTTNSTNYTATTASFNTRLTSPGDYAIYEVTVTNKGTLDAVLAANPTVTTGNNEAITYELEGIKRGDKILKNNHTDTFTIKVQYNPSTTQQPSNLTSDIQVSLSYEQDLGQVDLTHDFNGTGTIYRYANSGQTQTLSLNQNIEDYLSNNSYKTEWSIDSTTFNSMNYLKHEVSNYAITASYACLTVGNTEYCLQGAASYSNNLDVLRNAQSWFNSNNGSCSISSSRYGTSSCNVAGGESLYTQFDGYVNSGTAAADCAIGSSGYSLCTLR